MDRSSTPSLLPIFRSQQQAELLALLLGSPELELTLTQIAQQTNTAYASVHREIDRAEKAGLITSRRIGKSRLVQANTESPYFTGLSDILVKAFGPPALLNQALSPLAGIHQAFLFGSWAARFMGVTGERPVNDLDLLILGNPNRDEVYASLNALETRLGREIQVVFRDPDWLETGAGTFHATLTGRPLVEIPISSLSRSSADSPQSSRS